MLLGEEMLYTKEQISLYDKLYLEIGAALKDHRRNLKKTLEKAIAQGYPIDYDHSVLQYGLPMWIRIYSSLARKDSMKANLEVILTLIIENGADPNPLNYKGQNLLYFCALEGISLSLFKKVMKVTDDIDVADYTGQSLLHLVVQRYACWSEESKYFEEIKLLLDAGADPDNPKLQKWLNEAITEKEQQSMLLSLIDRRKLFLRNYLASYKENQLAKCQYSNTYEYEL